MLVNKNNIAVFEQRRLKRKFSIFRSILQINSFPLHSKSCAVVHVFDETVFGQARVEIGHQGSYVLCGRQPGMQIVAGVEKTTSRNSHAPNQMAIEGEIE